VVGFGVSDACGKPSHVLSLVWGFAKRLNDLLILQRLKCWLLRPTPILQAVRDCFAFVTDHFVSPDLVFQ
jgi:hypothetical protein